MLAADPAPRTPPEQLDALVMAVARMAPRLGDWTPLEPAELWAARLAVPQGAQATVVLRTLNSELLGGCQVSDAGQCQLSLTMAGWHRAAQLRQSRPASREAFVAMWLDPQVEPAWRDGFRQALEACGLTPVRVDGEGDSAIDDEVIARLRRARVVIADATGTRPNVYYEAGLAQGLGIPVVWTVHADHERDLAFDTRQLPHLIWRTPEELRTRLAARLRALALDLPAR
jgi:hypothetical protein